MITPSCEERGSSFPRAEIGARPCFFSISAQSCARARDASQYRFIPQHSVATSRFRRGFSSRLSIHRRRVSGTFRFLLSLPVGTDTELIVCVSGFVSYTTDTLYKARGKGDGAVNLSVCISKKESGSDARLVCVLSASGAKTVRYDCDCAEAFKANGFVGRGEACRWGRRILVEKGRRVERSDEMGVGAFLGIG